jgi:hypothetical protein
MSSKRNPTQSRAGKPRPNWPPNASLRHGNIRLNIVQTPVFAVRPGDVEAFEVVDVETNIRPVAQRDDLVVRMVEVLEVDPRQRIEVLWCASSCMKYALR